MAKKSGPPRGPRRRRSAPDNVTQDGEKIEPGDTVIELVGGVPYIYTEPKPGHSHLTERLKRKLKRGRPTRGTARKRRKS